MHTGQESARLFIDAWKMMVTRLPTGTVVEKDGVIATIGHVELPFLNVCFHDGPISDVDEVRARIRTAKELASGCPHPWLFALSEEWAPDGWEAAVAEEELAVQIITTGMAANELKSPRRPLPELEFRRVNDAATARDIAELNGLAYEMPLEMVECICNLHLWNEDSYGYVGYLDDIPVTCSATFPVNDTAYVALVATHPKHDRKGYAEAVMRQSVERSMQGLGLKSSTLHATDIGRPLYGAMGYEGDARFHLISELHEEE